MPHEYIDHINKKTMRGSVAEYARQNTLTKSEEAALNYVSDAADNPILDIGIGGGRTVAALRRVSKDYVGIDYVNEMVMECRKKFPGVRFEQRDARKLTSFENNSFHTIMFSMNGISMVDHEGRMEILQEVYRLLSPGGVFLFSTYNQDSADYRKLFRFPEFMFSKNLLKSGVRSLRYACNLLIAVYNRSRFRRLETYTDEYFIVNDKCHNYATMLYYITQANQYKQLTSVGFDRDIIAFDSSGNLIKNGTPDDSIFYIARKPSSAS
ncbi:MAG: class I SAM-dependent methyltransferase [Deltaproteobacteria bacterium]|nr:class I SAM-dependent methyltransferase [Deltaproteobacteria bacterium]